MAGQLGNRNRNVEEERGGKGGATSLACESDPLTHNASGVEAEGTDDHANSRAGTHIHTHTHIMLCQGAWSQKETGSTGPTRPDSTSPGMHRLGGDTQSQVRVQGHVHTHKHTHCTRPSGDRQEDVWPHADRPGFAFP